MSPVFTEPKIEWFLLTPYILVLGGGVLGVMLEALVPPRWRRLTQLALVPAVLLAAIVVLCVQWDDVVANGALGVLGGSLLMTAFTMALQVIILVVALIALLVIADRSSGTDGFAPTAAAIPGSDYEDLARRKGLEQTEVYPLFLFAVGGMLVLPAAGDLLTMFIGLEILSLPLYVLVGLSRHRRLLSQEASLKYFLLGSFASALFLMGMALLYGYSGQLSFLQITGAVIQGGIGADPAAGAFTTTTTVLVAGVLLMLVGALFKVGAAPFHQWTPDVYQGAPTTITGFMAACTKAAAFGAVLRIVGWTLPAMAPGDRDAMTTGLWAVAVLTMLVGSVVAVVQHDVKRVLAYSSVAHAGFVLVAVGAIPSIDLSVLPFDVQAGPAVLFYLLAYGVATVGAFAIVHLVRETGPAGPGGEAVVLGEATHLSQWAGLGRRSPWLAGTFALFLLSFAGIPLTAGFIGKFTVFSAAVDAGLWWLALIGVLCSAIAVFFYVRIVVLMFFVAPTAQPAADATAVADATDVADAAPDVPVAPGADGAELAPREAGVGLRLATEPLRSGGGVSVLRGDVATRVAIAVCAVATVLLGVVPGPVLDLVSEAAKFLP